MTQADKKVKEIFDYFQRRADKLVTIFRRDHKTGNLTNIPDYPDEWPAVFEYGLTEDRLKYLEKNAKKLFNVIEGIDLLRDHNADDNKCPYQTKRVGTRIFTKIGWHSAIIVGLDSNGKEIIDSSAHRSMRDVGNGVNKHDIPVHVVRRPGKTIKEDKYEVVAIRLLLTKAVKERKAAERTIPKDNNTYADLRTAEESEAVAKAGKSK